MSQLYAHPQNPRKHLDNDELIESIKETGQLVPLLVRRIGFEKLQIISGHRRKSALEAIGEKYAECDVVDMTDDQAYKALMITNIQAKSLTEIEEAEGIKHMIDLYEWTQDRVSKEFGKSQNWVNMRLGLLNLAEPIKELIIARAINTSHARYIGKLPQEQQEEAITHVIEKNLSTRETAELVKDITHFQEVQDEIHTEPQKNEFRTLETEREIHTELDEEKENEPEIHASYPITPRNLTGTYQERKEAADVLLKIRLAIVDMSNPYYPDKLVELNLDVEALELMDKLENSMKWLKQKISNARNRMGSEPTNGSVVEFKKKIAT